MAAFDLKLQKRLAADVLKASPSRVRFDPVRLNDIKAAITKADIRDLIAEGFITEIPARGISRARARKTSVQKSKGLRKGPGSRKGKSTARTPSKEAWMTKIRAQRAFIKELKTAEIIDNAGFTELYRKAKGGFFRSVRHIKLYINEKGLAKREAKQVKK